MWEFPPTSSPPSSLSGGRPAGWLTSSSSTAITESSDRGRNTWGHRVLSTSPSRTERQVDESRGADSQEPRDDKLERHDKAGRRGLRPRGDRSARHRLLPEPCEGGGGLIRERCREGRRGGDGRWHLPRRRLDEEAREDKEVRTSLEGGLAHDAKPHQASCGRE